MSADSVVVVFTVDYTEYKQYLLLLCEIEVSANILRAPIIRDVSALSSSFYYFNNTSKKNKSPSSLSIHCCILFYYRDFVTTIQYISLFSSSFLF